MNSQLRRGIIALLSRHHTAHLAIAGPDGPWACVLRFIGDDLVLYFLEARASDLLYYLENRSDVVLTIGEVGAGNGPDVRRHVQIFGTAKTLLPAEIKEIAQEVRDAFKRLNLEAPGVYAVVQVLPARIHYYSEKDGLLQRQTLDVSPQSSCDGLLAGET